MKRMYTEWIKWQEQAWIKATLDPWFIIYKFIENEPNINKYFNYRIIEDALLSYYENPEGTI